MEMKGNNPQVWRWRCMFQFDDLFLLRDTSYAGSVLAVSPPTVATVVPVFSGTNTRYNILPRNHYGYLTAKSEWLIFSCVVELS